MECSNAKKCVHVNKLYATACAYKYNLCLLYTSEKVQNSYTIDQITITAEHYSVEPYNDPNGKFTKRISIMFNIKNETDSAFGYVKSWEGRLPDGFKLESLIEAQDLDLIQVPSGGSIRCV